jgi:hypothetical protein
MFMLKPELGIRHFCFTLWYSKDRRNFKFSGYGMLWLRGLGTECPQTANLAVLGSNPDSLTSPERGQEFTTV